MIRKIHIENIKGIENKEFELNISPNKPTILVAPNGFGKSSFAFAFNSLMAKKIKLDKNHYYQNNLSNLPKISVEYEQNGNVCRLIADNNNNTISREIDTFVINSQTYPKGIGSQFGTATARLEIRDVTIINKIPSNCNFNYALNEYKIRFGKNGKIIPNLNNVLSNKIVVKKLSEIYPYFKKANSDTKQQKINEIINRINSEEGTTEDIINICCNEIDKLGEIRYLQEIAEIIHNIESGITKTNTFLMALQLVWLYNDDEVNFKNACEYSNYKLEKQKIDDTLNRFNCTWRNIRTSETGGKLVVRFPEAQHISNGQRDILSFISMLLQAKKALKKENSILIIDEVFDYLDEANLISAQYYISEFIEEYKKEGKKIYPLILTHLDPELFNTFAFKKTKIQIHYLDRASSSPNQHMEKLLRERGNKQSTVSEDISRHLLHYHSEDINKRKEFSRLLLKETWGEGKNFYTFIYDEVNKYLDNKTYCPLAVCAGVRVKIEEITYNKIQNPDQKNEFLTTDETIPKLEKAEEFGVISPEIYYLLRIIYNDGLHWKNDKSNFISKIDFKLKNKTIKHLIESVFK
ncbi:hypothetical protein [Capnocytophaga canis]|uniref:hypothetical protein n=1 Tax=Capnocytophaga canis TaxID=1848903 RepID=UPI0005A95223|nr:hypothetical protein [Capnocytophaga canis]